MAIVDEIRLDKRILERNLRKGLVTEEEYRRYLKELKDLSGEAVLVEAQLEPVGHPVPGRRLEEEEDI